MRATARRRGATPTGHRHRGLEHWAASRQPYLDNLKAVLIAAIIAIHGVLGYVGFDQFWSYADVQEVTLAPLTEIALFVLIGPFALFMIALLFLVAGLLTPPSLERKGPARFAIDRLLRLGLPFAVFTFGLWPLLMYALYHPLGQAPGSYWAEFLDQNGHLDTGPLWFVGVLLIFSLAYAGWTRLRAPAGAPTPGNRITAQRLLQIAGAVALATFVVRLVHPAGSESFTDLNLWEWPACIGLFVLGITASRQGWLTAIPDRLRRQSRTVTLASAVAMTALGFTAASLGVLDQLPGGWRWPALGFTIIESTLTVFGSVWLLAAAQRHLGHMRMSPAIRRSAYAAFLLQGPVLIGLAVALRPLPLGAEVKALLVAGGGVAVSFALGWLLLSRVPAIARIL